MIPEKYDPKAIEGKWQRAWEKNRAFRAADPGEPGSEKPKYYCLSMLPYPSGSIHMGHVRNYSIGDITSRYKKMRGFNVLQPIGWDAFGLPAENAAIQRKVHPKEWTLQNIEQMKSELKLLGFAYDWEREIATCLPEYYRWEQKLFREFYEKGLAYKKKGTVNWCPSCETVLANEQVQEGLCWRCDSKVEIRELSQWYYKITAYADQLLSGHQQLDKKWPDRVLEMQKHWIGQSEGCRIQFRREDHSDVLEVFTTRPDTLFGVTFVTISAHHPLAEKFCIAKDARPKLEAMRQAGNLAAKGVVEKNGFATGSFAIHPLTKEAVPVWVGDFVVMDYGTGAVMGVPAHDERDYEFAKKYSLPIQPVIYPKEGDLPEGQAYTEAGVLKDSGPFSGMDSEKAKSAIAAELTRVKLGSTTIQYRLRDWGISRQRYWGSPIPVVYCESCEMVLVPEKELPVELPADVVFDGKQGNPLERHASFVNTKCPKCGKPAKRETDTMDTFMESSWYFLRYLSPKYDKGPFERKMSDAWMPIDRYIGGIEHACMHLLYARFFYKVLRDWGYLKGDEPFASLLTQGMVIKDGAKMSKSKGNVVAPTAIIDQYGADTARLFCMFAAPPEKDLDWNEKGVEGCHRFLHRIWRLFYLFREELSTKSKAENDLNFDDKMLAVRKKTHWTIRKMSDDIESDKFNTAISAAMELVNEFYSALDGNPKAFASEEGKFVIQEAMTALLLCLSPYAPHLCEELWEALGHRSSISAERWPAFRPELLADETFLLVVQVNGKVREKIEVPKSISKDAVQKMVLELPKLQPFISGKQMKQFVYVPERLANVVVA